MKKIAIALAVGASALLGVSAASAADNPVKAPASTDITQSTDVSSDMSSRQRRHARQRVVYRYRGYSRPHYDDSYAYAPRSSYGSYGYAPQPQYYGGGPGIGFSFGGGGGHHGGGWGHHGW